MFFLLNLFILAKTCPFLFCPHGANLQSKGFDDIGIFWPIQVFDIIILYDFFESFELSIRYFWYLYVLTHILGEFFDKIIDLEDCIERWLLFCSVLFLFLAELWFS